MQRIVKFIFFIGWMFFYSSLSYANTFNITPAGSLPTSIQAGQTISALYNVTSIGTFPGDQYHIILAMLSNPSNVTQDRSVANSCGVYPINPTGCILKLNIVGPVSGPVKICDDWLGQPGLNCNIPANPNDFLNISAVQSPQLTITPQTVTLQANASQVFTVTNTSTAIAAINVTLTIPANVQTQLTGPPVYNGCGSIAPRGSCTITITAGASPNAQSGSATVQGTNTAAPAPTVAITIGAAPALIISPPTTTLGPNGTQQFVVVNTSTTITANNVTINIPLNVQQQLTVGTPVYSGCGSIAPLGSCTITITAVASPNAQSGTATVQGTNTATPAPTVAITTGAAPALTVSPQTTILGPNGTQQFTVVNTSTAITANNVTINIPLNVQQQLTVGSPVYSGCGSIAPLGSCTITITASASPNAQSGTATVQGTNTAAPAPTVAITTGAAPALTVSPPTTTLGPNNSQQFIVTNTSNSIAAQNITMTIPANVQGQLTSLPVYSGCGSIAPLGSCTITITAVVSPNAQSGTATVQGTNTAAPAPTVAITTGAAPALTVSPPTTTLGPNGTQQFTVTNIGTIVAQNITMTIPANVQGQLTSLPVYSGCGSIAPLDTCTITITAVAAPNAQSGTATVQGTNTGAPAPTVAITTGAAPVLTASPQTTNLASSGTQQFTVTNTGTIAAQNISMTISANVQTQLVAGTPSYSSDCASLAAGANTCVITLQAVSSPSSQSGIGTIQGTNTAAPAPVVSIFIPPVCTVLGSTTVTNTGLTNITGAVCVAPGTAITDFPPGTTNPAGQLHSNDAVATADHNDANTLYNTIVSLPCGTNLSGQDLGSLAPLPPGVYCFNTTANEVASGTLTLNGNATDKWYFQIGTTLTTGANANVVLTGGALPGNVYWQIGTSATFGADTAFQGQVIAFTSLTVGAGMSAIGRLWATNGAVTLSTNTVGP